MMHLLLTDKMTGEGKQGSREAGGGKVLKLTRTDTSGYSPTKLVTINAPVNW
jgi:hypothetical protein